MGEVYKRGKALGSNASEMASQEAGHLLGNAQEMLEKNINEVGKGMGPAKGEGSSD